MSKTRALRNIVMEQLKTVPGETYHRRSASSAMYPHKVFTLTSSSFPYGDRDDIELEVDLWNRGGDPKVLEDIADSIEKLFKGAIYPAHPIYPAFFLEARYYLEDPDKALQHIQLRFLVQLHETED